LTLAEADAFYAPSIAGPLRQGEILSDVKQVVPVAGSVFKETTVDIIEHRFAVIVSQDCDLEQDFNARAAINSEPGKAALHERRQVSSVLFCDAIPADELRGRINDPRLWETARQNKNERYHFLGPISAAEDALGNGVPSGLGLDFKRYFSLPVDEVYAQAEQLKNRRTVLLTPYAEHLSVRFFFYQLRIALPKEHQVS
jgi:hypothetical protein